MNKSNKSFFPSAKGEKKGSPLSKKEQVSSHTEAVQAETVAQTIERHLSPEQRISSQDIPLNRIRTNPYQAREEFTDEDIEELAESIRHHGFISTLLVRPDPNQDGYFQLAYGERRWRAAQRVEGLYAVPCRISTYSDLQMEDMCIIENLQRKPLNPIEEARGLYKRMQRIDPETGKPHSIRSLAAYLGVARHRVEIPLRLVDIPADVQAMVKQKPDTVRIAYELAKLPTPEQRQHLISLVLEGSVSTRDIIYMVDQQLKAHSVEEEGVVATETKSQSKPRLEQEAQPFSREEPQSGMISSNEQVSARADSDHETPQLQASKAPSMNVEAMQRQAKMQRDIGAVDAVIKRWSQLVKTEEEGIRMAPHIERWLTELQELSHALTVREDEAI